MKKVLHVFPYEKFAYDYITKINELFGKEYHEFFLYGELESENMSEVKAENIVFAEESTATRNDIDWLKKEFSSSSRIILHSLFVPFRILVLVSRFVRKYPEKFFWNIWGHDLYNTYWKRNESIKNIVKENFRRQFIKNLRGVGYIPGDFEYLKNHYDTSAQFFLASYSYDLFECPAEKHTGINVMLGNSATRECQYEDSISRLATLNIVDMKVYCVLSYPASNIEYIESVVDYGRSKLGDNFVPLTDYMRYEDYMSFLSKIDVAIFNHNRQQALGNIASLLYLGKKVFVSKENACGDYFERMGAKIYDMDLLLNEIKIPMDTTVVSKNSRIVKKFFSDVEFAERWKTIFEVDL